MKKSHVAQKAARLAVFAIVIILSFALCATLTACDLNLQKKDPTPSHNGNSNETPSDPPEIEEPSDGNDTETPEEQETPSEQEPPEEQQKPSEEVEHDITREEFERELAIYLQNYYNENVSLLQSLNISDTNILMINAKDSKVYFSCKKTGTGKVNFGVVDISTSLELNTYKTYKQILENINLSKQGFTTLTSRITEQGVPEDICAFALSQSKVKAALSGVSSYDIINYKVINTTLFTLTSHGNVTDITMLVGNRIVTLSMGGHTGTCKTQREYLRELQYGYLSYIENIEVKEYRELSL